MPPVLIRTPPAKSLRGELDFKPEAARSLQGELNFKPEAARSLQGELNFKPEAARSLQGELNFKPEAARSLGRIEFQTGGLTPPSGRTIQVTLYAPHRRGLLRPTLSGRAPRGRSTGRPPAGSARRPRRRSPQNAAAPLPSRVRRPGTHPALPPARLGTESSHAAAAVHLTPPRPVPRAPRPAPRAAVQHGAPQRIGEHHRRGAPGQPEEPRRPHRRHREQPVQPRHVEQRDRQRDLGREPRGHPGVRPEREPLPERPVALRDQTPYLARDDPDEGHRRRLSLQRAKRLERTERPPAVRPVKAEIRDDAEQRLDGPIEEKGPEPELPCEDRSSGRLRWDVQRRGRRRLHAERQRGEHVRPQVDREHLHDRERERDRQEDVEKERDELRDVAREHIAHEAADILLDGPPFLDGRHDRGEVVVGEDDVRRLLGHLRAAQPHGHADVGGAERGGVVHAVAGHHDHLAGPPQHLHHPQLLLRRRAREGRAGLEQLQERPVIHRVDRRPLGQAIRRIQPDGGGHRARGRGVIARQDHDPHAGAPAGGDRRGDLGPRRVVEADQAQARERAAGVPHGEHEDALAARGRAHHRLVEARGRRRAGQRHHRLGRPLHELPRGAARRARHRHVAPTRVERGVGDPRPPGARLAEVHPAGRGPARERHVHRIALAIAPRRRRARVVAQRGREPRRLLRVRGRAPRGDEAAHRERVLREGPRLVRADGRHRPDHLDRGQAPYRGAAGRHALRADRERHAERREQPLGDERHDHADRERERAQRADAVERLREHERGRAGDHRDHRGDARELRDLALEQRALAPALLEEQGDLARGALGARREDERLARAGHHGRAAREQARERELVRASARRGDRRGVAIDGGRLAREHREVDREAVCAEQDAVGRDDLPCREPDHVARDELARGHAPLGARPRDAGAHGDTAHEAAHDLLGAVLLEEREHAVEHDDRDDGEPELRGARGEGQPGAEPQQQRERVRELREERPDRP
ncbi:uncharacterized protein SOCE836_097370 [Sorangium cellulosum]|uniref:Uncharacterized protein n=1 Tax=Sorangium cellulosum TaxID=56 RepID=A0A4V0NHQ7_SORCE|nr:uncharacterized protein SOCE836_097370 [Sorangium cellulosum]